MELQMRMPKKANDVDQVHDLDLSVSKMDFLETARTGDYKRLEELLEKYAEKCIYNKQIGKDNGAKRSSLGKGNAIRALRVVGNEEKNDDVLIGAITPDKNENVFHLILKRPPFTEGLEEDAKPRKIEHFLKYMECANVLFEKCNRKVLLDLVNQQDNEGNTPLHYAAKDWPQTTVEKLLSLGANIAIKNKNKECPLNNITAGALEDYLETSSVKVEKANDLSINDYKNFAGVARFDGRLRKALEGNESSMLMNQFMMDINNHSITFDYSLLVPTQTGFKPEMSGKLKDKSCFQSSPRLLTETYVLEQICKSSEHREMVIHPVIKLFIWMKWCLIRKFISRNLRLKFFYVCCICWFLVSSRLNRSSSDDTCFYSIPVFHAFNDTSSQGFCEGMNCCQYSSLGYLIMVTQFVAQLFFICTHTVKDIIESKYWKNTVDFEGAGRGISTFDLIVAVVMDLTNIGLQTLVVVGAKKYLWVVVAWYVAQEMLKETTQMYIWRLHYFKGDLVQNILDWFQIISLGIILSFNSINVFEYDTEYPFVERVLCALVLFFITYQFMKDCVLFLTFNITFVNWIKVRVMMFVKVARSFFKLLCLYAPFFIVFGFGFYMLLHTVRNSSAAMNSSSAIKSSNLSGLNDNENEPNLFDSKMESVNSTKSTNSTDTETDPNLFDSKISSIIRTFIMFTGELEFDGMAETMASNNVGKMGQLLGYAFILLFVFMVVIVLMNLLNGMAIQDIRDIMTQSEVLIQKSRVDVLLYFERSMRSWYGALIEAVVRRMEKDPQEVWSLNQETDLFYSESNKKKIIFNQREETLDIFCCNLEKCRYDRMGLKLTKQNISNVDEVRKCLIKRNKEEVENK